MERTATARGEPGVAHRYRLGVQELIRVTLDEHSGDEATTIEALVDHALADNDYIRELFGLAVHALNGRSRSTRRSQIRHAVETSGTVRSLGRALARPLLEFPLQDGALLKDAYQPQVERAAAQFGRQGETMMHLCRWLQSIQARMEAARTVGEVLDELTVRQLFDETETGVTTP